MFSVMTFPAETYLLITHLTETDPAVSSFSSDGASFHVYDQSKFAQKYLPQYFKHSNYGSFVRQLNLYGFTSSRLKQNSDVVVWTHEYFRRDRKDLLSEIKRGKKPGKSVDPKPSHVNIDSRAASPSLCDEISSTQPSEDDADNTPEKIFSRQVSGPDHDWLESEFAYLKQQNRFLERKLDTLLKITLRLSPVTLEEVQLGEKRRRVTIPDPSFQNGYCNPIRYNLESIAEEQKIAEKDEFEIEPEPYQEDRSLGYASTQRTVDREDSLKAFIDIMLSDEEKNECEAAGDSGSENNFKEGAPTKVPSDPIRFVSNNPDNIGLSRNTIEVPPEILDDNEMMADAVNATTAENSDEEYFGFSLDDLETTEQVQEHIYQPSEWVAMSNAAVEKVSAPQPIQVVSSGVPLYDGDIEEGNVPVGVTVISAELIDVSRSCDSSNEVVIQRQMDQDRRERRHRRVVFYIAAFVVTMIVAVAVITPIVVLSKKVDDDDDDAGQGVQTVIVTPGGGPCSRPGASCSPDGTYGDKDHSFNDNPGGGGPSHDNGFYHEESAGNDPGEVSGLDFGNYSEFYESDDEELDDDEFYKFQDPLPVSASHNNSISHALQPKNRIRLFGNMRDDSFFARNGITDFNSVTITIEGTLFECSQVHL